MKPVKILLALATVSCLAAGISGIQKIRVSSQGTEIVRYQGTARFVAIVIGLLCLIILVGLNRKRMWAWKCASGCFLILIAVFPIQAVEAVGTSPDTFGKVFGFVSQIIVAAVAMYLFWRLWIPTRKYFEAAKGQ